MLSKWKGESVVADSYIRMLDHVDPTEQGY